MPVSAPETLKKAWGEQVLEDFLIWLEEVLKEKAIPRDEYRQVLSRLDILEKDVSLLREEFKGHRREMLERFDRIDQRFDRVNERFDRVNERFDRVNERFDQMYERMLTMTRWTVGTLALFGTIISIILAIGQFIR